MDRQLITTEQIDAAYRDVWSSFPHSNRLSRFAHKIAEQAVKQERERLGLPKSYGGSTFDSWGDQKEGCTVRIHFTDAQEAEEWFARLTAGLTPREVQG